LSQAVQHLRYIPQDAQLAFIERCLNKRIMEHISFLLGARTRDYFDYIPVLKYVVLAEPLLRARVDSVDEPASDIRMNLEGEILGIFSFLN
jgi:hypothetical protein